MIFNIIAIELMNGFLKKQIERTNHPYEWTISNHNQLVGFDCYIDNDDDDRYDLEIYFKNGSSLQDHSGAKKIVKWFKNHSPDQVKREIERLKHEV